jgi:hypothetical protein
MILNSQESGLIPRQSPEYFESKFLSFINQSINGGHVPPPELLRFPEQRSCHSFPSAKGQCTQRPRHKMSALGNRGTLGIRALTRTTPLTPACCVRYFSVLNRPPPKYPGHVPLTFVERGALALGSAVGSLLNPRRGGNNPN